MNVARRAEEEPVVTTSTPPPAFDYSGIPLGYYDAIAREGHPVRRLWHLSKFERVIDYLPTRPDQSILDIGCFAGTFLSLLDTRRFTYQLGVDILPEQIAYAQANHGCAAREFRHVDTLDGLAAVDGAFDCVTLIEVIEHLRPDEIRVVMHHAARLLKPGGKLVVTTPNYASAWPVIEILVNKLSDLSYEEQHITRFTYRNIERRIAEIAPESTRSLALEQKTTTHLVTPFLAALSFDGARRLSKLVPHKLWRVPLGNLVLAVFAKR